MYIILLLTSVIFNGCNKPAKTSPVINSPTVVLLSPTPTVVRPVSLPTVSATHVYSLEQLLNAGDSAVSNYSDLKGALDYFDRAIKTDNKCARAWYRKGDVLYGMKKYEEALKCYNRALEINDKDAYVWKLKSRLLVEMGRYEEAIECCNRAIHINPQDPEGWYNKGEALTLYGDYQDAITCYDRVLEINPNYFKIIDAWCAKGDIFSSRGMYEEAIECYNKSISPDNRSASYACYGKANVLYKTGKYEEAVKTYDKVLEICTNLDFKDTKSKKEAILKLLPEKFKLTDKEYTEGIFLYRRGKYKEAVEAFDRSLKFNSEDSYAWQWKGRILVFNLEKYEEAIKCFDKVLKIVPENEDALKYMGYSLYKAAMYEKAIIYFDKTLEIDNDDFFSLYNKGNALYELKKYKEAVRCFDRALEQRSYVVIENREKAMKGSL